MDYPILWSIGRIEGTTCPCCGRFLSDIRQFKVVLAGRKNRESKVGKYRLLYCNECNLPFINSKLSKYNKSWHTGYFVPEFVYNGSSITRAKFYTKMITPTSKEEALRLLGQDGSQLDIKKQLPIKASKKGDELVSNNTFSIVAAPRSRVGAYSYCFILKKTLECRKCQLPLVDSAYYIPIDKKGLKCIKVPGRRCPKCGDLYVNEDKKNDISALLTNNPYASKYRLLDNPIIERNKGNNVKPEKKRIYLPRENFATKEEWKYQNKLARCPSSMLLLKYSLGEQNRYYTIVNDEKEADPERRILHYSSKKARLLLTLAFVPQSRDFLKGIWKQYKDLIAIPKTIDDNTAMPIIQNDIVIRKGGGYHEKNKQVAEVVNALLYSPYTHMLEIVRASYDREYNEYYMDPTIFRQFIDSYGNPGILIRFSSHSFGSGYESLNEESILKVYGYNVSQTEGLLTSERRAILTELVDLNIVTISRIVYLLDFFISTHPGDQYYYARCKWEDDREFISNYKANPSRFIIGGRIHK